nr:YggS family pyridoxal phosphate-dependent enzyme [Anaerolineae bacterium]
ERIAQVQAHIAAACARAGRHPDAVTLVAVSKTQPPEVLRAALAAGLRHFGENRVEEAAAKMPLVNAAAAVPPVWHMIGKAKLIPPLFQVVHSVDTLKLAQRLAEQVPAGAAPLPVLLEINISGEDSKAGLPATGWQQDAALRAALWDTVRAVLALPALELRGLMTMAPFYDEPEQTRPVFAALAQLAAALRHDTGAPLPDLSMGMTNDYTVAIEEGATIVRVGRALFGERPAPGPGG